MVEVEQLAESIAQLTGIKKYSSFRFEVSLTWKYMDNDYDFQPGVGVRVRKHDAIGEGLLILKRNLPPIQFKTTMHREEGYLSQSEHFWKFMITEKEESKKQTETDDSVEKDEQMIEESLHCPDSSCQSRFNTKRGLESHLVRDKHVYYKQGETVTDYGK